MLDSVIYGWKIIGDKQDKKGWIVHFQRSESTKLGSKAWHAQVFKCNFKNKESDFNGGFALSFFWLGWPLSLSLYI